MGEDDGWVAPAIKRKRASRDQASTPPDRTRSASIYSYYSSDAGTRGTPASGGDGGAGREGRGGAGSRGGEAGWSPRAQAAATAAHHLPRTDDGFVHLGTAEEEEAWRDAQRDATTARADEADEVVRGCTAAVAAAHARRAKRRQAKAERRRERRDARKQAERDGVAPEGLESGDSDDASQGEEEEEEEEIPLITPGTKRMRAVLGATVTEEDIEQQMEDDDNRLVWHDVPPPEEVRAQAALGPVERDTRAYCFACESGGPSVSAPHVAAMAQMWREGRGYCRAEDLAREVHEYFVKNVCARANRIAVSDGRQAPMVRDWSPACIREHFTSHVDDPDTFLVESIHALGVIQRKLYLEGVFQQNSRPPYDPRVSEKRTRMLLTVIAQRERLYKNDSTKMAMYNGDKVATSSRGGPVFNPRKNLGGVGPSSSGERLMSSMFGGGGGGGGGGRPAGA